MTMSSSCLVYDGLCNIILENRDDTYDGSIGMRVSAIGEEGESTSDYSVFSHEAQYNKYCLVFSESEQCIVEQIFTVKKMLHDIKL